MENKRPYVNYAAKQQAQAAKQDPKPEPVESVAANAVGVTPQKELNVEKRETPVANKVIEQVNNIAEESNVKIVNVASLNIRTSPDVYSNNIIGQLTKNAKVKVIREIGDFSQIGENRFVMTMFLS